MPFPQRLARFNRRVTNRLTRRFAAWLPGFAIIVHTGRRSGTRYETPINAFPTASGYRVALTYGPEADWVRNVVAAGRCELRVGGRRVACRDPRLGSDPAHAWAPWPVRLVLGRIGATQYLDLTLARAGDDDPAGG